jgi:glycosyltransferase involved in cell wall biosynthesis
VSEPLVTCIMLTADRQAMADRAIRCFKRQSYANKRLLIYDTGDWPFVAPGPLPNVAYVRGAKKSIGKLRNIANVFASDSWAALKDQPASGSADILTHWDDDDISYPDRITEQVAALQELRAQNTGIDVIGSRGMWFWDQPRLCCVNETENCDRGQAWYYLHTANYYCVCSSMAYWRTAWERNPFPDDNRAESRSLLGDHSLGFMDRKWVIATIHEGNRKYYDEARRPGVHGFARGTPVDDERIRKIVEEA